jgi:hypothetical protein
MLTDYVEPRYCGLVTLLSPLKAHSKALVKPAADVLLTVTMDSEFLPGFVQHLNSDEWFVWLAEAFRPVSGGGLANNGSSQDVKVKEKLSVVFQKLSKFRYMDMLPRTCLVGWSVTQDSACRCGMSSLIIDGFPHL